MDDVSRSYSHDPGVMHVASEAGPAQSSLSMRWPPAGGESSHSSDWTGSGQIAGRSNLPSFESVYVDDSDSHYLLGSFLDPQSSGAPDSQLMPPPPLPAPRSAPTNGSADLQQSIRRPKNKRWQPSDAQWNTHKGAIRDLYITNNQSLETTMKFMEDNHGFLASYVSVFLFWKLMI